MLSTEGSNIKLTQVTIMIQEILKFTAWLTTYPHEKFKNKSIKVIIPQSTMTHTTLAL